MEKGDKMNTPGKIVNSHNSTVYDYLGERIYWKYDLKQDIQILTDIYNQYKDDYVKLELCPGSVTTGTDGSYYIRGLRNFRENEELEKAEKELESWKSGLVNLENSKQRYYDGIKAAEEKLERLRGQNG